MRRLIPLLLVLVSVTLRAETFRLPEEETRWSRIESANFDVVTSAGERNALWTAQRLETLYSGVASLRGERAASQWNTPRLQFFTFGKRRDLQPYLDTLFSTSNVGATGAFFALRDRGIAFVDASGPSETAEHELIHAALASPGRPLPLWLEEGLAEFFSHYRSAPQRLTFGRLIPQRTFILRAEQSLPIADLFARQPGDAAVFGDRKRQAIFYAQSWAAVHALMSLRDKPLDRMTALVGRLLAGASSEDAIRDVYDLPLEEFARAIERYGGVIPPRPLSISMPVVRSSDSARRTRLSRGDALTLLGNAMLDAKPLEPAIPREHYDAALAAEPENPAALAARANLLWSEDRVASDAAFERACALAPSDPAILLRRGEFLLSKALGMVPSIETPESRQTIARSARGFLERARNLVPRDARVTAAWAASFAVEPAPPLAAIEAISEVRRTLPERVDIAAAQLVMLYNSAPDEAEKLFSSLDASDDPQFKFAARAIKIDALVARANQLARNGDHVAAAAIARRLAAEAEGDVRTQLEAQATELEAVAEANRQIALYNDAVAKFNARDYAGSAQILDRLIESGSDAEIVEAARELRKKALRKPG